MNNYNWSFQGRKFDERIFTFHNHQTYSDPRGYSLSASCGPNWKPPETILHLWQYGTVSFNFQGALNWAPPCLEPWEFPSTVAFFPSLQVKEMKYLFSYGQIYLYYIYVQIYKIIFLLLLYLIKYNLSIYVQIFNDSRTV